MKPRRVVITGIGVVAPNGIGKEAFWKALCEGKSGISRITSFDVSNLPTQIAGQVRDFDPGAFIPNDKWKAMGRQTCLALGAAALALQDAGLELGASNDSGCCLVGTSNPSYDLIETEFIKFTGPLGLSGGLPWALKAIDPFSVSSAISYFYNFRDASKAFCTSCTAGLTSIGQAFREVRNGSFDIAIAGSVDSAIFPITFLFFCAAEIMSKRNDSPEKASRPFDKGRDGGVLSEGAGIVILESLERATERGADIIAEVIGYGESAESVEHRRIKQGMTTAMHLAMEDARVHPYDIDYICAHAPSDPTTDVVETQAIKQVMGDYAYRTPVSSIKSMIGNPQSAAGPLQVAAAALSIKHGFIPPTINLEEPDPECDLDYVPLVARRASVQVAMVNSHGINGTDACLLLANHESRGF